MEFGLFSLFIAGLLTFVTPCVLPLIPIYLSALIGGDVRHMEVGSRGQLILRAILFSVGFISVFTAMGLAASSIGQVLVEYKGAIQIAGAMLILLFGLKFLGIVRIPFFDRIVRADDTKYQTRFGSINALVMGVVFAAGWSPCVGPVLGSVLTYTASQAADPATGALYLALYGAGFALPLIVTAVFAEAGVKLLRRINPHLPKIEKAIGLFLIVIAGSLIFDLAMDAPNDAPKSSAYAADSLTLTDSGDRLPVMVELYSKNCPICKRMDPLVDGIVNQCHGKQVLVKMVDISDPQNRELARSFRVLGVPTFLFLDVEGNEAARLVGEQTEKTLKQALSALRGEPCPGISLMPADMQSVDGMGEDNATCDSAGFHPVDMNDPKSADCDAGK